MLPHHVDETATTRSRRSDIWLGVIAAVATVGFAWTGFQSSAWLRHRFTEADKATELNEQALAANTRVDSLQERDVILYAEWAAVLEIGNEDAAAELFELFRDPVKDYIENAEPAIEGRPLVPPFEHEEYDLNRQRTEAQRLSEAADRRADATQRASEMGARYGGIGVIFAAVLAGAGVATRFERPGIRRGFIIVGATLATAALILLLFTPVGFV